MPIRRTARVLIAGIVALAPLSLFADQAPSPTYIERMSNRVTEWQKALPEIRTSASAAAAKVMQGGNLYVAGPQGTFQAEANGRAGGLMLTRWYAATQALTSADVVLAATTTTNQSAELQKLFENAERGGATVVLFGNAFPPPPLKKGAIDLLPAKPFGPDPAPTALSLESISNLIGLWGWTGEFITACVAHGQMPCVYESFGLPGGPERGESLKGLRFHELTTVTQADAKDLGARFFQKTAQSLKEAADGNREAFKKAAAMIGASHAAGTTIRVDGIAHIFPAEFKQAPTPSWFQVGEAKEGRRAGDLTLYLGYQAFPWPLVKSVAEDGSHCIVACSHLPTPEFTATGNVYLNPHWDLQDGGIELNGYDVRLLPLSGIMDSAIYWQLVELSTAPEVGD